MNLYAVLSEIRSLSMTDDDFDTLPSMVFTELLEDRSTSNLVIAKIIEIKVIGLPHRKKIMRQLFDELDIQYSKYLSVKDMKDMVISELISRYSR